MTDLELALRGGRLTSAQIHYYHPDHPGLVNPNWFLWQQMDVAPRFPRLNAFVRWWNVTLDGKVHSIRVWVMGTIQPTDLDFRDGEYRLQ